MLWFAIFLCLLVSFLFSGIEAGIFSVSQVRLRHRIKRREPTALRVEALLEEPGRLLLTVVIVTNLMNIFAITLATTDFVSRWGVIGYALSLVIFLPLILFVLELFPKSLFRRFPYSALALLSWPVRIAELTLSPLLRWEKEVTENLMPAIATEESRRLFPSREEFKESLVENEKTGAISPLERELIHDVVDFHAMTARELMRPLTDFPSVPHTLEVEALIEASQDGAIDRFLVRSETGNIEGIVHLFDVLLDREPRGQASAFARPLSTIAAHEKGGRLLRRIRAARTSVALVMDGDIPLGLIERESRYRRMLSPR